MAKSYLSKYHGIISDVEKNHFWFRARKDVLSRVIRRFIPTPSKKTFLEVGFGTGELLSLFEKMEFTMSGVDINEVARTHAKHRSHATLYVKPFLQFTNTPYDALGMFDVLEHQQKDVQFLLHAHALLKKNGLLFVTVPAGPWLWSDMDKQIGHARRYTKQTLLTTVSKAGFEPLWCNYWNVFLSPFYAVWKIFNAKMESATPEEFVAHINPILNTLFFYTITIENQLTLRVPFLFGTSLIVVARKKRMKMHDSAS